MTDPLTIGVAVLTLIVAIIATWSAVPRRPDLDGERWFKLLLATALRGAVEANEGTADDWERQVLTFVLYHPAGRRPDLKVSDPRADVVEVPALPGEIALVESLAAHERQVDRWKQLYDVDEEGIRARLQDPADLGPLYDPARWIPGTSWDDLAGWADGDQGFVEALERRLGAHWVTFAGQRSRGIAAAIARLTEGRHVAWAEDEPLEARMEGVEQAIREVCGNLEDRVVLVCEDTAMTVVLRTLVQHPGLRDLVVAVVSVGGVIGGRTDVPEESPYHRKVAQDWLERWFREDELDTDLVRVTPYLSVQFMDRTVDPPGVQGLAIEDARFPPLKEESLVVGDMVQLVDLGLLPDHPKLPVDQVARALIAMVGLWTISQRGGM